MSPVIDRVARGPGGPRGYPLLVAMTILDSPTWGARMAAHEERVDQWLRPHLERRRRGLKHPVFDFLFTYYSHRPARLRRWHPGASVVLADADPAGFGPDYVVADAGGAVLDTDAVLVRRRESVLWINRLLTATMTRAARFGCFGMHEWAMVYRQSQEELRHNAWPLRLGRAKTTALVDHLGVRCSHFDAFRFFTPAARPLNLLQLTRRTQAEQEQSGCLHANMDLYRWSYKLSPLVPGELVADCFELALEIRTIDMRASPYDLEPLGFEPVRVETEDGRATYAAHQRDFAARAAVLRREIADICARVLGPGQREPAAAGPLFGHFRDVRP